MHDPADPETRADVLHAVVAFGAASFAWLLLSAIVTAGLAATAHPGLPLEAALRSPDMFAIGALVQTAGLGAVVLLLRRWFPGPMATARPRAVLLAATAGLTVGLLPGWLAERLQDLLGQTTSTLTVLSESLDGAPWPAVLGLVLAICVVAPITEELAFRGFLWRQLQRVLPGWAVLLLTSLVFVGYHLDPLQTPSLVPTALLLGWVRLRTGSVLPAIAAHIANNAVAMAMLLGTEPASVPPIPLWLAVVGTVFSWAITTFPTTAGEPHARLPPPTGPHSG